VAGVTGGEESWLVGVFRLPRDDGVRFPDRAAFIGGSFQAFVCDLRPKLLQRPRCRLVRMPFGVIRSPRHLRAESEQSLHLSLQREGIVRENFPRDFPGSCET